MTRGALNSIPLAQSFFCVDCESIGNCSTHCPACASTHIARLSAWLNRQNTSNYLSNLRSRMTYNDKQHHHQTGGRDV